MTNIGLIKSAVRRYIAELTDHHAGITGAYFHGSLNQVEYAGHLPDYSDVDVMLIVRSPTALRSGKRMYDGVIVDIAFIHTDAYRSAEEILGNYRLAAGFHNAEIIFDHTGTLRALQQQVAARFDQRERIEKRCDDALTNAHRFLSEVKEEDPVYAQVTNCLFGHGAFAHVLLVAALKNPTIRKRYVAVRQPLFSVQGIDAYEELLAQAGLGQFTETEVRHHLHTLEDVFNDACRYVQASYRFAGDISDAGRQIAINGSKALTDDGYQREAMFWIAATHCRCREVLERFAPETVKQHHDPAFQKLLQGLKLQTFGDRQASVDRALGFIPKVMEWGKMIREETGDEQLERQETLAYFWKAVLLLLIMIVIATLVIKKI